MIQFHHSRSSLSPISSTGQFVDCPASATMVHNVSHHARLMRLEVKFLRDQLAEHGERLLMAGADLVLPHVLLDQVSIVTRYLVTTIGLDCKQIVLSTQNVFAILSNFTLSNWARSAALSPRRRSSPGS